MYGFLNFWGSLKLFVSCRGALWVVVKYFWAALGYFGRCGLFLRSLWIGVGRCWLTFCWDGESL